jgi:metal transporter CNNM
LDIEKAPIPEFPSNEEVVGVITMEDVIKELLQAQMQLLFDVILWPD